MRPTVNHLRPGQVSPQPHAAQIARGGSPASIQPDPAGRHPVTAEPGGCRHYSPEAPAMNDVVPGARRGLRLHVYRPAASCADTTPGGVSAWSTALTVVGIVGQPAGRSSDELMHALMPRRCQVRTPDGDAPAVWLLRREWFHETRWTLVPALGQDVTEDELRRHLTRFVDGGNVAGTFDDRFTRLVGGHGPLPVFDRAEF